MNTDAFVLCSNTGLKIFLLRKWGRRMCILNFHPFALRIWFMKIALEWQILSSTLQWRHMSAILSLITGTLTVHSTVKHVTFYIYIYIDTLFYRLVSKPYRRRVDSVWICADILTVNTLKSEQNSRHFQMYGSAEGPHEVSKPVCVSPNYDLRIS